MKVTPMFDMTFRYTELTMVNPIKGEKGSEGKFWGLAEGEVVGERIRGKFKCCNHPRHRPDNVNVPDVHGVISTDDGETVYFEMHGYGIAHEGRRAVRTTMTFRTASERYAWLNTAIAAQEGAFRKGAGPLIADLKTFELVPEVP